MTSTPLNRIPAVFVDEEGRLTREAFRFLLSLQGNANEAAAGEVATPSAGGLEGGGAVADGVTLSIRNNGVTNAMLATRLSTSVMGRAFNSAGNAADIQAVQNDTVLTRSGDQLMFSPHPQVESLTLDDLLFTGAASASTAAVTHSIPIDANGVTMYILLSNAP